MNLTMLESSKISSYNWWFMGRQFAYLFVYLVSLPHPTAPPTVRIVHSGLACNIEEERYSERVYTIREGETLELTCLVTGHPRPQVSPEPWHWGKLSLTCLWSKKGKMFNLEDFAKYEYVCVCLWVTFTFVCVKHRIRVVIAEFKFEVFTWTQQKKKFVFVLWEIWKTLLRKLLKRWQKYLSKITIHMQKVYFKVWNMISWWHNCSQALGILFWKMWCRRSHALSLLLVIICIENFEKNVCRCYMHPGFQKKPPTAFRSLIRTEIETVKEH